MADVIRLVCPECDAVHRVKSVTLGKLYRCKKCRSGLITMQPAILSCPNCGATTPPAHIEVSRLITCDECEKAPLMEVRMPGVRYPVKELSKETEQIATQMSAADDTGKKDTSEAVAKVQSNIAEDTEVISSAELLEQSGDDVDNKDTDILDENEIFKADTNFIVKEKKQNKEGIESVVEEPVESVRQLEVFEDYTGSSDQVAIDDEFQSEEVEQEVNSLPPEIEDSFYTGSGEQHDDIYEVSGKEYIEEVEPVSEEKISAGSNIENEESKSEEDQVIVTGDESSVFKGRGWKVPAWIPVIFALLLMGLYGFLLADLDTVKQQLAVAQESLIRQSESFQQERVRFMNILREARNDKRELEKRLDDLENENAELRSRSLRFEGPDFSDE